MSSFASHMKELADKKQKEKKDSQIPKLLKEIEGYANAGHYYVTYKGGYPLDVEDIRTLESKGFKVIVKKSGMFSFRDDDAIIISWE